jgi:ferredoxin
MTGAARYRVAVDTTKCIGSAQCVARVPLVFDQRESDGIVVLREPNPPPDLRAAVETAALLCPAQAITIAPSD